MTSDFAPELVLLDLSAAFDDVELEHTTLLDIPGTRLGITGAALKRHKTYLPERSYWVVTGGSESKVVDLHCGLPQGSCLGPLNFSVYAAGMQLVASHGVSSNGFADDSQLSKHTLVSVGKSAMTS